MDCIAKVRIKEPHAYSSNSLTIILQKVETRGSKTRKSLEEMMLKIDETKINLKNVSNQLQQLQNNQFVENRVYQDSIPNFNNVPKTNDVIDAIF